MPMFAPRVLSGVQPSGALHLGNYFGAIKQHIDLQHQYPSEAFYFIADYHALTTIQDRRALQEQTRNVALDYLALGLDPKKATFYRQSDLPQVCELMWVLANSTAKGLLERGHAYKDKVARGRSASAGLFLYPVLMAADILLLRATKVPVGDDQKQHMEMTRDIAKRFNSDYKRGIFPVPETVTPKAAAIVPGLDGNKMSKSFGNTISIFADEDELARKVAAIKTDSTPLGQSLDPEGDTVFKLYRLVAEAEETDSLASDYRSGAIGYGEAKKALTAKLRVCFEAARERRENLAKDPDFIEDVLREGVRRARSEAEATLETVRDAVGLSVYHRAWAELGA